MHTLFFLKYLTFAYLLIIIAPRAQGMYDVPLDGHKTIRESVLSVPSNDLARTFWLRSFHGNVEWVDLLLRLRTIPQETRDLALIKAAASLYETDSVVRVLLANSANPKAEQCCALQAAVSFHKVTICALLLDAKACPLGLGEWWSDTIIEQALRQASFDPNKYEPKQRPFLEEYHKEHGESSKAIYALMQKAMEERGLSIPPKKLGAKPLTREELRNLPGM